MKEFRAKTEVYWNDEYLKCRETYGKLMRKEAMLISKDDAK